MSLGQADPLEKGMATRSSILAWRIPWTEEPSRLQSMGSQKSQAQLSNSPSQISHHYTPVEKILRKPRQTQKMRKTGKEMNLY